MPFTDEDSRVAISDQVDPAEASIVNGQLLRLTLASLSSPLRIAAARATVERGASVAEAARVAGLPRSLLLGYL